MRRFFTAGRTIGGLVLVWLTLFVGGAVVGGEAYRFQILDEETINATASVTAPFNWTVHKCDGPFAISYSMSSASGTPDIGISYQVLNVDGSTYNTYQAWDATNNGDLTTSTVTATLGNNASGLPFTPPVSEQGRFSIYGVASNPADTKFSMAIDCYRSGFED